MSHRIQLLLGASDRNLLLRLLKNDGSEPAVALAEHINWLVRRQRDEAREAREWQAERDEARRIELAASAVRHEFVRRHAGSFPSGPNTSTRGGMNLNVQNWLDRGAVVAALRGEDPAPVFERAKVREAWRSRAVTALGAVIDDLRTPEGMRAAALGLAARLRQEVADREGRQMFMDRDYDAEIKAKWAARDTARADELERTGVIPGLERR